MDSLTSPEQITLVYTLCFLTRGDEVLMLRRRRPPNQGLWNGVGGHIEPGEPPLQSVLREVREETGFHLPSARFAGILSLSGFETPPGGLYIFTAAAPSGEPHTTDEGELAWKPRPWVCAAAEVVSNIHHFGPAVLAGEPPRHYIFEYRDGIIQRWGVQPLPAWLELPG